MLRHLNVVIVEDDLSFALELDMLIRDIGHQVQARVDNAGEALEVIMSQSPDLILMDIDIKGRLNGLEIAKHVAHLNIPILFITSYSEQEKYDRAKQVNAVGYLVKPINKYSLQSAIEMAVRAISSNHNESKKAFSNEDELYFKKNGVFQRVLIEDIYYIQANGDYTITHTNEGKFISALRLNELDDLLNSFLKVHRSFLVNLKKADSLDFEHNKILINGESIPFSRRMKPVLLKKIRMIK